MMVNDSKIWLGAGSSKSVSGQSKPDQFKLAEFGGALVCSTEPESRAPGSLSHRPRFGGSHPRLHGGSECQPGTVARARLPDWALPVTPDAVYSKPQNADLGNRKLCHKASGWRQCGVQLHEQTGRSTNLSPVCFWETTSSVPQFSGDSCVCWSDNILPVQVASRFHPEVSHLDCHKKVQARGHPSFPGGGN